MYCHVLAARIAGEPPAFRGKPRFCEKNTVKRRKEMNDERKQGNGKTSGVKKALRLKFPDIPSAWGSCSRNTTTNWSGHTHLGERSTLLCTKGAARAGPLTVPPVKLRPFATNCNDHLVLRIITGGCNNIAYVDAAHRLCFSLYYRHSNLLSSIFPRIPAPISRNLYSKRCLPVMGGSSPLSLPPSTSQAPSLEEHIAKGQEEKER
jgi:hypothetical protein